jgi:hypothetical protein
MTISLLALSLGVRAAEQVTISEFMASNTSTLRDEDNQYGDWIEIHNAGLTNVNLDGWYLTDAINNKTKWRFPATNINAGAYMYVFADGKDRKVPGATLHTSFNLSASGEYLALVHPDGTTIATEFRQVNNGYPGQVPDVSYGFGTFSTNIAVMNSNALVRWRIPDGTEATNWTAADYDDTAWGLGTNGVGYGATNGGLDYSSAVLQTGPVGYWRFNETSGTTAANIGSLGATVNATYQGSPTLGTAGPRPPTYLGFEANNNAPTLNGTTARIQVPDNAGFDFGTGPYSIALWFNPANVTVRGDLFTYKVGGNDYGIHMGSQGAGTVSVYHNGFIGTGGTLANNQWYFLVVTRGAGGTVNAYLNGAVIVSGTDNGDMSIAQDLVFGSNINPTPATPSFLFTGLLDEPAIWNRGLSAAEVQTLYQTATNSTGGTGGFVRTDVSAAMSNINASAYIRIPFVVTNATNISLISLQMRYNDGFAAYINGVERLRVNGPDPLSYNSAATNIHPSTAFEEYRLGPMGLLTGTNVLAIQGLNSSASDSNFLIAAEMVLTSVEADSTNAVFFTVPTPGAANVGGIANPGPAILEANHSPTVPLDSQNVNVTARIVPTFYPFSNVVMRYRIMFGSEIEVQMLDDGLHGDGAAGDGVFGATIPESASTNGQMIRWHMRAYDNRGNVSRWPIFASPLTSAEYLGTIVNPTNLTSKLPVVHFFAPTAILQPGPTTTQTGADSQAGAQVSLFFDGELYDNVHMELRGNSTAGFNKKSHRVEFNREHPFRYKNGADRIRKTSWVADWPDPTYMRQGLGYWLCDAFGAPAPFYEPMRLQLNGQFYQLGNHNDVHGEELLERLGLDPNGALYNAAGRVTEPPASTGGFDKKTRTWETIAGSSPPRAQDYVRLAAAIAETNSTATRATNVFDIFDVPEALDYLVAARWFHENDDVWANMSMYNDNDGDGLWRIIPFDVNLSWGAIFAEGDSSLYTGVQATNDTHKSHPLYGGQNILARSGPGGAFNRVYDVFFQVPELRQMFLRRLRTLLDTYIKPIGTPTNSTPLEQMILAKRDLIAEEAIRDRAWWGWPGVGGQNNFAPGIDITNGVNQLLDQFLRTRRIHFYGKHCITNTALPLFNPALANQTNTVAGIPLAQPTNAVVQITQIEFNPSSANQGHEFIQLSNPNPYAVDISGWRLNRGVDFTFKPGTVLVSDGVLYVTPDIKAFRTRTTMPMTGRALFVVGNYQGTLDARGEPLELLDDTGRLVHTNTYVPNPSAAQQYLRITEIMYHPAPGGSYAAEEYEYIELKNIWTNDLNLVGVHFTNGIDFAFTTNSTVTNLAAGQAVVLVKNSAAFISRYGAGPAIAGVYTGSLDNAGERIKLDDAVGEQILDFSYNNSWYRMTDGNGFSLVIVDETASWDTWGMKESWRPSGVMNGSPSANDSAPVVSAPIVVNEVLAHSVPSMVDAIELYNPTTNEVDISDWWISDDFFTPRKYRIPTTIKIPAGGYYTFYEGDFNAGPNPFAFSSAGDEAYVFAGDATGNLTGYYEGFGFDASEGDVSFGRYFTSDADLHYVAQKALSFNATNAGPKVGPIVISEIMYHSLEITGVDTSTEEYVELQNISTNDVALFDVGYPTNRWKLDDAIHYSFSTNDTIPAGGFLVVVSFDPTNTTLLASFRARYGIGTNVAIVGPYTGQLDNSEDKVELKKPDTSAPAAITTILVERVHYHDNAPWDANADGSGASLQRIVVGDYGNDSTNWLTAFPNPGTAFAGGTAPTITAQPTDTVAVAGRSTNSFTITASGTDLRYQWRFSTTNVMGETNVTSLAGETNATLTLAAPQLSQAGDYSVLVYNGAGAVFSSNAHLTVLAPVTFTIQPTNQNVQPGTNVTLVSQAIGNGTVRYQWIFEGTNLPDATNANYSFTNATIAAHHGTYQVIAMDDVSVTASSNAFIFVMVKPAFVTNPVSQTVLQGSTAIFTAYATGAPPIWYRWLRQGTPLTTNTSGILVITNVQFPTNNIRVLATNLASGPAGVSMSPAAGVPLFILADADKDGMWDIWETNYFGSTNASPTADIDGDLMINRDEYVAGTIPTNALSLLKIVLSATNASTLTFVAQSNISYSVQCRTNFTSGIWSNITSIVGQASVRTIEVNTATSPDTERYYRVVTPHSP